MRQDISIPDMGWYNVLAQDSGLTFLFLFILAVMSLLAASNPKLPPQGRIFAGAFSSS